MSEPRPIGAIEENVFDLIAADFTCLARIADAQGMTPELEAIANSFDANLVERIAAVLDRSPQGAACRCHRARGNDVTGAPMLALAPGRPSGLDVVDPVSACGPPCSWRSRFWCRPYSAKARLWGPIAEMAPPAH